MRRTIGRLPKEKELLLKEKDRVLGYSFDVLVTVQDNVTNEHTFLMDYDDGKIDAKIDKWIKTKTRVDERFESLNASNQLKGVVNVEIEKVAKKMKADYRTAYNDINKFMKKVDHLGLNERKLHFKLQNLMEKCAGDMPKFKKLLGPLRLQIFDNVKICEKMIDKDKELKILFMKKVFDIDHKYRAQIYKVCETA